MPRALPPTLLLPLAALLTLTPLILHGGSCGHDQVFHVQGWYDAAAQLRHLHYPHWSFTSAWSAGEPRFIFYPPLSWLLGALLTVILPPQIAVYAFIFLCLALSGLAMYRLAAHFTTPTAALIAATLYLANPYMLFNAFERSAFAELLAAAWIPLLFLAVLRARPTIPGIAIPLALLWLTNAPAAVMASYAFALLATLRVTHAFILRIRRRHTPAHSLKPNPYTLILVVIGGTLLGLALPAFYLIPAAYERRFVQVALAIIPNMRIQDNFFFDLTTDPGHNGVNHQISLLALTLLTLTVLSVTTLLVLHLRSRRIKPLGLSAPLDQAPQPHTLLSSNRAGNEPLSLELLPPSPTLALAILTAALTLMLFPVSLPLWNHIPELSFLQFPWRLTALVSAVLTFSIALLLHGNPSPRKLGAPFIPQPGVPSERSWLPEVESHRERPGPTQRLSSRLPFLFPASSFVLSILLGFLSFHLYTQFCQPNDRPAAIAQNLRTHHGFPPTDEYTPNALSTSNHASDDPDSDVLRTDNPAFWLVPTTAPNTPAPGTLPTAAELNPNLQTDDTPVPLAQSVSAGAPSHFNVHPLKSGLLVLNLRDYPNWDVTDTAECRLQTHRPAHRTRDDGLIAIPLDCAATHTIDIHWRTTLDQLSGIILSTLALLVLVLLLFLAPPRPTVHPAS